MFSTKVIFWALLSLHAEVLFSFIFQSVTAYRGAGSRQDGGKCFLSPSDLGIFPVHKLAQQDPV